MLARCLAVPRLFVCWSFPTALPHLLCLVGTLRLVTVHFLQGVAEPLREGAGLSRAAPSAGALRIGRR